MIRIIADFDFESLKRNFCISGSSSLQNNCFSIAYIKENSHKTLINDIGRCMVHHISRTTGSGSADADASKYTLSKIKHKILTDSIY